MDLKVPSLETPIPNAVCSNPIFVIEERNGEGSKAKHDDGGWEGERARIVAIRISGRSYDT